MLAHQVVDEPGRLERRQVGDGPHRLSFHLADRLQSPSSLSWMQALEYLPHNPWKSTGEVRELRVSVSEGKCDSHQVS